MLVLIFLNPSLNLHLKSWDIESKLVSQATNLAAHHSQGDQLKSLKSINSSLKLATSEYARPTCMCDKVLKIDYHH